MINGPTPPETGSRSRAPGQADRVAALRRALGARLAAARAARGWTQQRLGSAVWCDRSTIAKVEAGERGKDHEFWQATDTALNAGGVLVATFTELQAARAEQLRDAHLARLAEIDAHAARLHQQAHVASAPDQPVGGSPWRAPDPRLAAVTGPGHPVPDRSTGGDRVAVIAAMSDAFQTADRRIGGGALYQRVLGYLTAEIGPCLVDPPGDAQAGQLFAAAASMTEVAGWMAHDAGEDHRARQHFEYAYRLATAAGHEPLSANVCASMAHLAIDMGQPADAERIATTGLVHTAHSAGVPGVAALRARLNAMRARAHAATRADHDARRALEAAHADLDTSSERGAVEWIAGFDHASLAGETALCLHQLGQLGEAEQAARQVVTLRVGDRVRSRAFGQLTLARILTDAGRIDEAAAVGLTVCETAPALSSARVWHRLDDLGAALQAHQPVREVAALRDRLADLHQAQPSVTGWPV